MATLIVYALNASLTVALLLSGWFCLVCLLAPSPGRRRLRIDSAHGVSPRRPRMGIVVPAHNEQTQIGDTVSGIKEQLADDDRLIVVADNCVDDTARVAREAGATVVERFDAAHRGKGYALARGVDALRGDSPELVVTVDADCALEPEALNHLATECVRHGRPVQARYLLRSPNTGGTRSALSQFAVLVKNRVRLLGVKRLGVPSLVTGSGVAFPWEVAERLGFGGGHIVEDMQVACDLAIEGRGAVFCDDAVVVSDLPADSEAATGQRRRWEHGHLSVLTGEAPRLLGAAFRQRRVDLLLMALDLAVPPLSLLILGVVALAIVAASVAFVSPTPLIVAMVSLLLLATGVMNAWARFASEDLPLATLIGAPFYALGKAPLYAGYLFSRQIEWVRTPRDAP